MSVPPGIMKPPFLSSRFAAEKIETVTKDSAGSCLPVHF